MTELSKIKLDSLKNAEYISFFIEKKNGVITSSFNHQSFGELLEIIADDPNNITDKDIDETYIKVGDFFYGYEEVTPEMPDDTYVMYTIRIK